VTVGLGFAPNLLTLVQPQGRTRRSRAWVFAGRPLPPVGTFTPPWEHRPPDRAACPDYAGRPFLRQAPWDAGNTGVGHAPQARLPRLPRSGFGRRPNHVVDTDAREPRRIRFRFVLAVDHSPMMSCGRIRVCLWKDSAFSCADSANHITLSTHAPGYLRDCTAGSDAPKWRGRVAALSTNT